MSSIGSTLVTVRSTLETLWKGKGIAFQCFTRPYRLFDVFEATLVQVVKTTDTTPVPEYGLYQIKKGSTVEFGKYGLQDTHPILGRLTDADTNLVQGYRTNGGEDVVIEGLSASARPFLYKYDSSVFAERITSAPLASGLTNGQVVISDPGCLMTPAQLSSPFALANQLFEDLAPNVSLEVEWNRSRTDYICELASLPEGIGRAYNRSHGEPTTANRYRIPEGLRWNGTVGADSDMLIRGTVCRDIVFPLNASKNLLNTTPYLPESVLLPVQVRLHGATFGYPSRN